MFHIALLLLANFALDASELIVNTPSGEDVYLEIGAEDSFEEVMETLQGLGEDTKGFICFNFFGSKFEAKAKSSGSAPRNYYLPLTQSDAATIHELLTTLAYQNLIKIGTKRSSLTRTGDQIQHLHPLKFLQHVFTNDELIVAMRNIKDRMIWGEFISPIYDSLQKEANLGNITPEQIQDLALWVKLDYPLLMAPIQSRNWSSLIDILINKVPRSGDAKRYDQ